MGEKFSIIETLNVDKLYDKIDEYICTNNETDPYVFMSDETAEAIIQQLDPMDLFGVGKRVKGKTATWTGYKVFIDDDMKYGDIEIR